MGTFTTATNYIDFRNQKAKQWLEANGFTLTRRVKLTFWSEYADEWSTNFVDPGYKYHGSVPFWLHMDVWVVTSPTTQLSGGAFHRLLASNNLLLTQQQ